MNINFKRILSSTLAVLAIGGGIAYSGAEGMSDIFDTETISAYAAETKNYNGLEYVEYALDTELQARIVGYTGTEAVLEIPAIIDGRQVIIDSNAFNGNTIIKKVTVSEGITHILSGAFANCPNLEEINVPASLEIIMLNSFTGSDKLKFTGDGVPTIVSTMATSWCLDNNIYSITSSDTNLKYYQRAVKIASELKKDLTYDSSAPNQGDAASVLNTLKATCGGYSRVFYHICLAAGIPEDCIKVVGDCHCHAWNYINISGDWYNVDVTNSIYFATDANYAKTMFNNTNTSHAYHTYSKWYNIGNVYWGDGDQDVTLLSTLGVSATTAKGDVNGDGSVNVFDLSLLKSYVSDTTTTINIPAADWNIDGNIDTTDISELQAWLVG